MSLAERIDGDVMGIFYRESEFARWHSYNGQDILCIVDGEDMRKSQSATAVLREWDAGAHVITLRIPEGQLADAPLEGEKITFDGKLCTIQLITSNEGEWVLTLRGSEARTII